MLRSQPAGNLILIKDDRGPRTFTRSHEIELCEGLATMEYPQISGTPIFEGEAAQKGYALNKMCFSFNSAENRAEFVRDEDAYCGKFGLTPAQRAAVKHRN